jgi:biotin transport system substrate-specific component
MYLVLGILGLPVFSGFQSGAALLGPAGGYLWGFLAAGLVFRLVGKPLPGMILGMLACYGCGAAWFWLVWQGGQGSVLPALAQGVLPYVLPDALKLLLAWQMAGRLRRVL